MVFKNPEEEVPRYTAPQFGIITQMIYQVDLARKTVDTAEMSKRWKNIDGNVEAVRVLNDDWTSQGNYDSWIWNNPDWGLLN